jgi:pimeloyl-ACP methyl ester carboxylesterase
MTADLNWFGAFPVLGRHFRVVALDLRGHGNGIATGSQFRLEDCADDIAMLARIMGLGPIVPVGYSMGGLIAQLLWRRHPQLVAGLVLCSTARNVRGMPAEQLASLALLTVGAAAQMIPFLHLVGAHFLGDGLLGQVDDPQVRRWARSQMGRTSLATAVSAVNAVSQFTSHQWVGTVDVPTSVLVTTRDSVVPERRQRKLAAAIPGSVVYELPDDHCVCVNAPTRFAEALLAACRSVAFCASVSPRGESA